LKEGRDVRMSRECSQDKIKLSWLKNTNIYKQSCFPHPDFQIITSWDKHLFPSLNLSPSPFLLSIYIKNQQDRASNLPSNQWEFTFSLYGNLKFLMHSSKTVLGFETQYPMQMSPFIEVPMQMSKKRKRKSWSKKNY
jgi:hypothetical protein